MDTFKERAGQYLREAPGGLNLEKIAVYSALAFGFYVIYKSWRIGAAVGSALNSAGSAAGRGLYDLFHPNAGQRATSVSFVVWFPNEKTFHAVDSLDVSDRGVFSRNGIRYQMVSLKTPKPAPGGRTINKMAIRL
jgi:hypothetical protein